MFKGMAHNPLVGRSVLRFFERHTFRQAMDSLCDLFVLSSLYQLTPTHSQKMTLFESKASVMDQGQQHFLQGSKQMTESLKRTKFSITSSVQHADPGAPNSSVAFRVNPTYPPHTPPP